MDVYVCMCVWFIVFSCLSGEINIFCHTIKKDQTLTTLHTQNACEDSHLKTLSNQPSGVASTNLYSLAPLLTNTHTHTHTHTGMSFNQLFSFNCVLTKAVHRILRSCVCVSVGVCSGEKRGKALLWILLPHADYMKTERMRREWVYWLRDGGDRMRVRTTETERAWQNKKKRRKWKNWVTSILLASYPSSTRSTPTQTPPSRKLLRISVERSIERGHVPPALSRLSAASHENSSESDRLKELLGASGSFWELSSEALHADDGDRPPCLITHNKRKTIMEDPFPWKRHRHHAKV